MTCDEDYWKSLQAAVDSVEYQMTNREQGQIQEILKALSHEEQQALADQFMTLRHLRAEKGDVQKAIVALQRTLKWRNEFQVQDLKHCLHKHKPPPNVVGVEEAEAEEEQADEAKEEKKDDDDNANSNNNKNNKSKASSLDELASVVRKENETGKLYIRGYDKDGRALLYMRPGKENTNDEEGNIRHLVYHMEKSIACSAKNGQSKICIVIDYDGFSLRHAPPMSTSKYTLDVLQKHYPERLHRAYICNPPWIFKGFWKVISPFVDPVTKQKLQFCSSASDFEKVVHDMGGLQKANQHLEECAGGTVKPSTDFDTNAYLSLPLDMSLAE